MGALFATGDEELLLVTAHVVDELGERDGGGGERDRETERESQAERKMRRRCRVAKARLLIGPSEGEKRINVRLTKASITKSSNTLLSA